MFAAVHEELRAMEPAGQGRAALESAFRALCKLEARVVERRLAYTAAIDDLDDGGVDGVGMNRSSGRHSDRAARRASRTAAQLKEMPRTRQALAEGRINAEHADAAADAAERVSPQEADDELSEHAASRPADLFSKAARKWAGAKERDQATEHRHAQQWAARELHTWTDAGGMRCLFARLDPEVGALVHKALEAEVDRLWRADGGRQGKPDELRTRDQRAADALASLLRSPAPTTTRPHPKYQLVVAVDAGRLTIDDPAGDARIVDGEALAQAVLERICCDAEFLGAIYGQDGAVLWQGRGTRLATDAQWTQLIARDGGCVCCGAAPSPCEAHHLVPFAPPIVRTDRHRPDGARVHPHTPPGPRGGISAGPGRRWLDAPPARKTPKTGCPGHGRVRGTRSGTRSRRAAHSDDRFSAPGSYRSPALFCPKHDR